MPLARNEQPGLIKPLCNLVCSVSKVFSEKGTVYSTASLFFSFFSVLPLSLSLSFSLSLFRLSTAYFLLVLPLLFSNGKFEKNLN